MVRLHTSQAIADRITELSLSLFCDLPEGKCQLSQLPKEDIPIATNKYKHAVPVSDELKKYLLEAVHEADPDFRNPVLSGYFLYPKGGYMDWHTNSNMPGWRIYITISKGKSFFRYAENEIITDWDSGFDIRKFHCPVWHCIGAIDERLSFGFREDTCQA